MSANQLNRRQAILALGCAAAAGAAFDRFVLPPPLGPALIPPARPKPQLGQDGLYRLPLSAPDHATGEFPGRHCPFRPRGGIREVRFSSQPRAQASLTAVDSWIFGIAVNGVAFHPMGPFWQGDAESGWQFDVLSAKARPFLGLDLNHAHVQPDGMYHYHGVPTALVASSLEARQKQGARFEMIHLGWAADGFPIYAPWAPEDAEHGRSPQTQMRSSYRLRTGPRPIGGPRGDHDGTFVEDYEYVPSYGDLDECNGRFGVTPQHPNGIYHYFVTFEFPHVPRFWKGTPHPSFTRNRPGRMAVPPELRG